MMQIYHLFALRQEENPHFVGEYPYGLNFFM